jgi:hypothetical protein
MARTALTLAAVAMLSFAAPQAGGAGQSGPAPAPPAAPPEPAPAQKTGEGAGTKTEADDKPKPAETAPSPGAQSPAPPSDGDSQSTLAALMREGFEVRTTAFVPAEAVTRQSGKVSSDAIVVTLQKEAASAVCFYTLKAYVSRKLSTIPACIVHR